MHSIRVTDYTGDLDTLREVILIGPFPDAAERDAELTRLSTLPGVDGNYDFEGSGLDPAAADRSATAAKVARAGNEGQLSNVLCGFGPDYDL